MGILDQIKQARADKRKLLAVLIDPDKVIDDPLQDLVSRIDNSKADFIFIGGSEVEEGRTDEVIQIIEKSTALPLIIFPGDISQITPRADAILFLSLVSGRNPDYLIGKHVEAAPKLADSALEVIPTAYILIEDGKETSVQRISGTVPMKRSEVDDIVNTARASEYLGMQLVYVEAGSGANTPVPESIITSVRNAVDCPLIVGGGIRNLEQLRTAYDAGADLVVIGTAIEEDPAILTEFR